jgi:hypothetical protein
LGARLEREGTDIMVSGPWGEVRRDRKAKASRVTLVGDIAADGQSNTASAAQQVIQAHLGGHEAWRRAHVLSSSEGGSFGAASDAERKRLLEETLDLGRFDAALELVRADLKEHRAALVAAQRHQAACQGSLAVEQRALMTLQGEQQIVVGPEPDHPGDRATIQADLDAAQVAYAGAQTAHTVALEQHRHLREACRHALRGQCSECGQERPASHAEGLKVSVALAATRVAELAGAEEAARKSLRLAELAMEEWSAARVNRATWSAARKRAAQIDRMVADQTAAVAVAMGNLSDATAALNEIAAEVAGLEAVEVILGLRGARVRMLQGAAAALSRAASSWMHALGMGPLTLEAGEDQRLALSVPGRGGGTYQGLSGGERRRTDLALQLGLSQMVGGGSGTLWLDEAFDALDRDGAERAAVVARELAATRCVVVISHSEALQEALRPDMVLACPL